MTSVMEIAGNIVDSTVVANLSKSLFLVGSKNVGKSTLLYNFLDINEKPRATFTLEYLFGRKTKQREHADKYVCHIWEYGGRLELLEEVLKSFKTELTMIVMLDLSNPKSLWNTLDRCLKAYKEVERGGTTFSSLVIIGGKYDVFKNYDPEQKNVICTSLRCVALLYSASLVFYSANEQNLMKRGRDILNCLAFGQGNIIRDKIFSHNKPLCICSGVDTWNNIGVKECSIDNVKLTYIARFPQVLDMYVPPNLTMSNDPNNSEPIIDSLQRKKFEDIKLLGVYLDQLNK